MLKISKERLNELYAKISESMGLYIPIKKAKAMLCCGFGGYINPYRVK